MRIYKVGGAVRDKILNIPCHDNDYVITGATEEEMLSLGYKKVGKSFPVFLHPETGEEYALARKEIKTGPKHGDFKFIFTPDIKIEEDSLRRDFTCNALYQDIQTGRIIDCCNGREDIKNRILRHISPHFAEDPLRVLRLCRFAAALDFDVAPETMALCKKMVQEGALKHLSRTRIWQEFEKALCLPRFCKFILTARECGLLDEILPEVAALWLVPEREDYHPEKNSGEHTILALKAAQSSDPLVNFAILFHDIGKTKTDKKKWPSHHNHDKLGASLVKDIAKRLNAPSTYGEFSSFVAANHMVYHKKISEVEDKIAQIAVTLSNAKRKEDAERFVAVLKADMEGRAISPSEKGLKAFERFSTYLNRLISEARKYKKSEIPNFALLLEKIKNKELAPSILDKEFAKMIIKKEKQASL